MANSPPIVPDPGLPYTGLQQVPGESPPTVPSRPEFPVRAATRRRLERLGNEFLADFLGRKAKRAPASVEVLVSLARVLSNLGLIEEGLDVDRRLVALMPRSPIVHYNLGCSLALSGRRKVAMVSLQRAVALGYDDAEFMRRDDDLACLREEPLFLALVAELIDRRSGIPLN